MRSLPFAAFARRPVRLAAPLLLAGLLAGCIGGETIAPASSGAIPGRYVLSLLSDDGGIDDLPLAVGTVKVKENVGGEEVERELPLVLRYATIDLYDDGTYVEVYDLDVMDGMEVYDTRWDVGSGTWTLEGDVLEFAAIIRPAILPAASTWTGYLGDGGDYAFNLRRYVDPPRGMHYRRY